MEFAYRSGERMWRSVLHLFLKYHTLSGVLLLLLSSSNGISQCPPNNDNTVDLATSSRASSRVSYKYYQGNVYRVYNNGRNCAVIGSASDWQDAVRVASSHSAGRREQNFRENPGLDDATTAAPSNSNTDDSNTDDSNIDWSNSSPTPNNDTGETSIAIGETANAPTANPIPEGYTPNESNLIGQDNTNSYYWNDSTGQVVQCHRDGQSCTGYNNGTAYASLGDAQLDLKNSRSTENFKFNGEENAKESAASSSSSDLDAPNVELTDAERRAEERDEADRNTGRASSSASSLRTGNNYERIRSRNGTNDVSRRLGLTDSSTTDRMAQSLQQMSQVTTQAGGMAVSTAGQVSQARLMSGDDYTTTDATVDNLRMSARTNGIQAGIEGLAALTAASRLGAHQYDIATLKNVQEKAENRSLFTEDRQRVNQQLETYKGSTSERIVSGNELKGGTEDYKLHVQGSGRVEDLTKKVVQSYDMDGAGRYELTEQVGNCDPSNQECIQQRNAQIDRRKNQFNARVDQTQDDISEVSDVAQSEQKAGRAIASTQMLVSTMQMASHLTNALLQKKMADKLKKQEDEDSTCDSDNADDCLWGNSSYDADGGDDSLRGGGDTISPGSSDAVESPAVASADGALDPDNWGTTDDFTPDRPVADAPGVAVFTPGGSSKGGSNAGGGVGSAGSTQADTAASDTGEAKTAYARGDSNAAYAGGRMRRGGRGGGGGGAEPSIDLKSILGQLLPDFGEESKKDSKDLLDYGAAGASAGANGSLLDREVNIFFRIGEAYQRNVQQGRIGKN